MALSHGATLDAFWVEEVPMSRTPCIVFWIQTCSAQMEFASRTSIWIAPLVRSSTSRAKW